MSPYRGAKIYSVLTPLILRERVFKAVPTVFGFWTIVFAAVVNAMVSSNVLPAAAIALAETCNASPMPFVVIAKLFESVTFGVLPTDHLQVAISHFWLILTFHNKIIV